MYNTIIQTLTNCDNASNFIYLFYFISYMFSHSTNLSRNIEEMFFIVTSLLCDYLHRDYAYIIETLWRFLVIAICIMSLSFTTHGLKVRAHMTAIYQTKQFIIHLYKIYY